MVVLPTGFRELFKEVAGAIDIHAAELDHLLERLEEEARDCRVNEEEED